MNNSRNEIAYRFDFVLKINEFFIVHREFNIKNYNEKSRESLEMKELMDELMGMNCPSGKLGLIPNLLKKGSIEYLWEHFNQYTVQTVEESKIKDSNSRVDNFSFELREYGELIGSANFSGEYFQPKIRVKVDVKEVLPNIMEEIRHYLGKNEYTTKYGKQVLKRNNRLSMADKERVYINE